jgi:hypothetical protein
MLPHAMVLDTAHEQRGGCRHCCATPTQPVLDLGMVPADVRGAGLHRRGELYAPLRLVFCERCRLLQLDRIEGEQALIESERAACRQRRSLLEPSDAQGADTSIAPHPTAVAGDARTQPGVQEYVRGLSQRLVPGEVAYFEQPNLQAAVAGAQLDLFRLARPYYPSLRWSEQLLSRAGLQLFDVEADDATGMLQLVAERPGAKKRPPSAQLLALRTAEQQARLDELAGYQRLGFDANLLRHGLLECLLEARRYGGLVAAYGSASTFGHLLSYCRLGPDTVAFLADPDASHDGGFVGGTRIPIRPAHTIVDTRPSHLLLLPWRQRDPLVAELSFVRAWGARFIVPLPRVELFD